MDSFEIHVFSLNVTVGFPLLICEVGIVALILRHGFNIKPVQEAVCKQERLRHLSSKRLSRDQEAVVYISQLSNCSKLFRKF